MEELCIFLMASLWCAANGASMCLYTETLSSVPLCDDMYGTVIEASAKRSVLECYLKCTDDQSCLSVSFDKSGKICKTNSGITDSSVGCSVTSLRYVEKPLQRNYSRLGMVCDNNADCNVDKAGCRDGICQCKPGYSVKMSTCECLAYCESYGTTFHEHRNYFLLGYNEEVLSTSLENCESMCLSATFYTCRTYEYDFALGYCYLQSDTALTQPHAYLYSDIYSVYHRNCA